MIVPRPYQREAIDAVRAAEARGLQRVLVALPTGTGKTVVFALLIRERGGRALVLVHRDELVWQAVEKLQLVMPEAGIGIVKAERDEHARQVVVASVQTLARPSRLQRLTPGFTTVVVDEAHHAPAASYQRILDALGAFDAGGPLVLGVTATPERGDRVGLGTVFEEIVYQRSIAEMVLAGYLCDLRAVRVGIAADLSRLRLRGGDYVEAELGRALMAADAPTEVAKAYTRYAAGRTGLVFTPTVEMAHATAQAFRQAGVPAVAIDGETPLEDRRRTLARLRLGEIRVVTNCMVLTEGFDEPSIDCVVVARPTASRALYVQMIGRGTRLHPGKDDCLILDVVGATNRHDLVTAASLFGRPPRELATDGLLVSLERERQERAVMRALGELVAVPVDLFGRRRLRWVRAGHTFVLPTIEGRIVLRPSWSQPGAWDVVREAYSGLGRVLGEGLPLEWAMGIGEDAVRADGAERLADPEAAWRKRPASEKQLAVLRRWGVPIPPGLTAGQASDLIAAGRMQARRLVTKGDG